MINVKTSKGIFQITKDLFESILKNTPELLMEDNPSANIFDIKKRYQDATGLTYNPNGDMFNALIKVMEKTGGDPEEFQKELQRIYAKSDNNENNFKENLKKILKGKEIQDYRAETNVKNQSSKKENEREIFISTIKELVGEDNFNKLPYSELNNWFEKWNKKDNKGKEKVYSEIGKELSQRFSEEKPIEQTIGQPKEDMDEEKPIENNKESIKKPSEEKFIEKNKKKKFHKKNKKPIEKNIEEKPIEQEQPQLKIKLIGGNISDIDRRFKNSLNGQWNYNEVKYLSYIASLYNFVFNGKMLLVKKGLSKFIGKYREEYLEYIDEKNKKGLISLFNIISNDCNEFYKKIEELQRNNQLTESENKKTYSFDDLSNAFIDDSMEGVEDILDRKNIIDDESLESSKKNISNNEDRLMNKFTDAKTLLKNKDYETIKSDKKIANDDTIEKRVLYLQSHYITNDTIKLLNELCQKNEENDIPCIKNIKKALIKANEDITNLGASDDKEIRRIKNKNGINVRKAILGFSNNIDNTENGDTKKGNIFNDIDEFIHDKDVAIKNFQKWYEKNRGILESNNNLLNILSNDVWNEFKRTLDYPNGSMIRQYINKNDKLSDDEKEIKKNEYIDGYLKKIIEIVKKATFEEKIPAAIENFYDALYKTMAGRLVRGLHFKFYKFGEKKLQFIYERPKQLYLDMIKNSQRNYNGLPMYRIYQAIDKKEFWNNAAVILCRSKKGLDLVTAALNDISTRAELNLRGRTISTGLNTTTRIYIINDTEVNKIKKTFGSNEDSEIYPLENDDNNINYLKVRDNVERIYFLIVTEGLVQQGKIASNIAKNVGRGLSKIVQSNNKSFLDNVTNSDFAKL